MPVNPLPKPPFVVVDTVAFSGGGIKPAKYVCVFDMGAGFFAVGYSIPNSRVEMKAVRRADILYGKYAVTADKPREFAQAMRDLAIRRGVSFEAYLTLGQMKPFNREEEVAMAKLSRKADPEPEEDEVEETPAPKSRVKAKAAPPPAKTKRRAAAPEPEEEEEEPEDEAEEEEEEPEEEEEEEEEEAPAAKAKAKAKVAAGKVIGKSAAGNGKAKPAPAPAAKAKRTPPPPSTRASGPDNRKIRILKKKHGAREGTIRADLLDTIYASKTVQEAVDAGVKKSDVSWAARSEYIELLG